jgi:hypothetical protein
MPDLLTGSIRVILIFIHVHEHFIDALDKPAKPLFRNVLIDQVFH